MCQNSAFDMVERFLDLCCTTCPWDKKTRERSELPYRGKHNSSRGCCTGSEATGESYFSHISRRNPNSLCHHPSESKTSGRDASGSKWSCDGEGDEICCASGSPEKVFIIIMTLYSKTDVLYYTNCIMIISIFFVIKMYYIYFKVHRLKGTTLLSFLA